ncbi:hypothetical protein [Methanosphaerula subterraneus]|uniref:hypothetical protein n=1 Tax=Methanosphaerula subterraneus TaxID=3350244 RepID=UPI003F834564
MKDGINRIIGTSGGCEPINLALELLRGEGYEIHYIDTAYRSPHCTSVEYDDLLKYLMNQIQISARGLTGDGIDGTILRFEICRRNAALQKVQGHGTSPEIPTLHAQPCHDVDTDGFRPLLRKT